MKPIEFLTMSPERVKELLPFILAYAEGKTLQWRRDWGCFPTEWADWNPSGTGPDFSSLVKWRVKPELQTPGAVFAAAAYPHERDQYANWSGTVKERVEIAARAVIEAYKQGKIDVDY